jgi:hypothetical protein
MNTDAAACSESAVEFIDYLVVPTAEINIIVRFLCVSSVWQALKSLERRALYYSLLHLRGGG